MFLPMPLTRPCPRSLPLRRSVLGEVELAGARIVWLDIGEANATVRVPQSIEVLRVRETSSVAHVAVANLSDDPLLLTSGTVLKGGWQTRVVERSIIVPPRQERAIAVPVSCVERGRWSPRTAERGGEFGTSDSMGIGMRRQTTRMKSESMRRTGCYSAPQVAVWQSVAGELARSGAHSATASYEAFLDGERSEHRAKANHAMITPPAGCNAAMLVPPDGGWWLEAFPSPEALAQQLESMLPDVYEASAATSKAAQVDVPAVLSALWSDELHPLKRIRYSTGDSFALAGLERAGEVVLLEGKLAHLSVGALAAD